MVKILLFLLLAGIAGNAFGQPYTYKPLALDTSTYWLEEYVDYDAGIQCHAERLFACIGDTTIGAQLFWKVLAYTTEQYSSWSAGPLCMPFLKGSETLLLHEDTAAKKVYAPGGIVLMDFNKMPGDTLDYLPVNGPRFIVDSVTIDTIFGVARRVQWARSPLSGLLPYKTIEGIGANYSFPIVKFGEWGTPGYRLKCFSKGGQILYTDGNTTNCDTRPPARLGVKETVLNRSVFATDGQQLRLLRTDLLPMEVQVMDITGRMVVSRVVTNMDPIPLNVAPGGYVLRLSKEGETGSFLFYVR